MFNKGSVRVVTPLRNYSRPRRFAKINKEPNTLSYQDLVLFQGYLNSANFPQSSSTPQKEEPSSFKFTGRNLSQLISSTLHFLTPPEAKEPEILPPALREKVAAIVNEKGWILMSKVKLYLRTGDDAKLYEILSHNRRAISRIVHSLSVFQTSLLIKRLTQYQMKIVRQFTLEQMYSSRLRKDSSVAKLALTKDNTYEGVRAIISKLDGFTTLDYEILVSFSMRNLRYKDALEYLSDMETKISEGDTGLRLTNSLWAAKIGILTRSTEETWSLDRYDYKSNRAQVVTEKANIRFLLNQYEQSKLVPDKAICNAIILALGKAHQTELLDAFISRMWVEPETLAKDSLTYPDFNLLKSIVLAFNYNYELSKPIEICNNIIQKHGMDLGHSQKFWETVLRCTGLQCLNVYRNLQNSLYKDGIETSQYNKMDMPLRHQIFDSLWTHILEVVPKPSKAMIRTRLEFGSLDSLIKDLPHIHSRSIDPKQNVTTTEAAFNDSMLFSYLNACLQGLRQSHRFYQAEEMIKKYSIDGQMRDVLLSKLNKYQHKYLRKTQAERDEKRQKLIEDEEDSLLGLW